MWQKLPPAVGSGLRELRGLKIRLVCCASISVAPARQLAEVAGKRIAHDWHNAHVQLYSRTCSKRTKRTRGPLTAGLSERLACVSQGCSWICSNCLRHGSHLARSIAYSTWPC